MKSTYIDPSGWINDIEKAVLLDEQLKRKRLEKVTNEYIGDTVNTNGIVPEDTGNLKMDIQRKSIPANGIVMANIYYAGYANNHNVTGVTDYLEEMWKTQPQVYRDMYGELLANDIAKI